MIPTTRQPHWRFDLLLALLIGAVAGVIYYLGSAPGVLFGDGGELQFAAWTAGLPHPTGYPLYMTLGWAWSHLLDAAGLVSPARAMTLLSVLFAAVAVGLTYLFTRTLIDLSLPQASMGIQRLAALLAALTFAFTPTFWSQAVVTEVYTLNAAFVALILWLAVYWRWRVERGARSEERGAGSGERGVGSGEREAGSGERGAGSGERGARSEERGAGSEERRVGSGERGAESGERGARSGERIDPALAALALAFGLSLAHHRTTLLLTPVVALFLVWQAPAGYWRQHRRDILWLLLLALTPLLLYLYVPLRANATPYLTTELQPGQPVSLLDRSPAGLISYLLGSGFSGDLVGLSAAFTHAPDLPPRFAAELTWPGVVLAGIGIAALAIRRRWGLLWLTGGSFLALTAFNLFYTIGDIAVFYIPSFLIACTWIGIATAWLANPLWNRLAISRVEDESREQNQPTHHKNESRAPSPPFVVLFVVIFLLLPAYLFAAHAAPLNHSRDTRAQDWWGSLLAANPPQGAMLVTNDRDEMMPLWYLQQVEGRRTDLVGVFPLLMPGESWAAIGPVVDSALATGRPVSLIKPMSGLEIKARLGQPDSTGLTPVLGPAITRPPAVSQDVLIGEAVRLTGVTAEPATVQPGQAMTLDLYWQPVAALPGDYTSFVQLLSPDGTKVAQSDQPVGGVFYPTSLWQPGETLLDRHTLTVPANAPPGPYRVLVGMYEWVDGQARTVGSAVVGEVEL